MGWSLKSGGARSGSIQHTSPLDPLKRQRESQERIPITLLQVNSQMQCLIKETSLQARSWWVQSIRVAFTDVRAFVYRSLGEQIYFHPQWTHGASSTSQKRTTPVTMATLQKAIRMNALFNREGAIHSATHCPTVSGPKLWWSYGRKQRLFYLSKEMYLKASSNTDPPLSLHTARVGSSVN